MSYIKILFDIVIHSSFALTSAELIAAMLCLTYYTKLVEITGNIIHETGFLDNKKRLFIARIVAFVLYTPVVSLGYKSAVSLVSDPWFGKAECEKVENYDESKKNGINEIITYIEKCRSSHTPYIIEAQTELENREYFAVKECFSQKKCAALKCLSAPTYLSIDRIDTLKFQAKALIKSLACGATPPSPPHPKQPVDPQEVERNERIAAMRLEGGRLLARNGVNYDALLKAVDKLTEDDKSHFSTEDRQLWLRIAAAKPLIEWSKRGLNASSKPELPIAIFKENNFDIDYKVAEDLSQTLREDGGLNITNDVSKAALLIEVSNVKTDSNGTRKSIDGSMFEGYDGTASFKIKMFWAGGNLLATETFYGSAPGSKKSAKAAALDDARRKAKEFVASMANKKQL